MKVVYVGQPFDRFFPPVQNSIGLIVYYTALELAGHIDITLYGKHFRDDVLPERLPFNVRHLAVPGDTLLQKLIAKYAREARWLRMGGLADDHREYRNKVRRRLAKDCPDLVHIMNYWAWCRDLKPPGSRRKLVLEMQCEWLSERRRDQVAHQLEVVDAVVAVSDHIATTFRAAFPNYCGVVATVGNGVDVVHFHPRIEAVARDAKKRRTILFVGRISPEKGLHTLIEAFSLVAQASPDVELSLARPQ